MEPSESTDLLFFAAGNNSSEDFDTNLIDTNLLLSEPIADEKDMTTRSQDTFDSFGDFADDIDIDLSEDDDLSLNHQQSISGSLGGFTPDHQSSSPALSPTIQKPSTTNDATITASHMADSFFSSASSSIHQQATAAATINSHQVRQTPARAASYSEGDQQSLLLQIQRMSLLQMQQQQQIRLQSSLSSIPNTSFHDTSAAAASTTAQADPNRDPSLFSQQQNLQALSSSSQHSLPLPQGIANTQTPANINDAMEKLCETMKRSAVTRNLVKQLGVARSNSGVGLMRTNSGAALKRTSSGKGSIGDMARVAPIRRPSNSKHSIKRGVLPQSSQHSLDGSNHLLQVDGRSIAHF